MATRTRTLGGYTATVYSQTFTQKVKSTGVVNTPASLNYSRTNQLASGIYKTMTDVTTPNFGKLRAEGGIINSPMSSQVEYRDGKCSGGQVVFDSSAYLSTYSWTGDMLLQYFPFDKLLVDGADPALLSHMTTLASTSAWAGVEGPEVQGQVFLAELLKTLRMIRKPCQGLRDYISNSSKWRRTRNIGGGKAFTKDVKRTTRESLSEGANAAANSWNEARFGWRPFLLEMESILDTLQNGGFEPRKTSRAKQTRSVTRTEQKQQSATAVDQNSLVVDFSYAYKVDIEVRAMLLYDFHNTMYSDFGLRWSEIPSTAWELIPFSFVVDWFANVGDFIQALSPKAGTRTLAASTTTRITSSVERKPLKLTVNGQVAQSVPTGSHKRTFETYVRETNVSSPGLTLELDLTQALRAGRAIDALALVTSLFPKRKKT